MDKDEAIEKAKAVERGELPTGSVGPIKVTGPNSLHSPGGGEELPPALILASPADPEEVGVGVCKNCFRPITRVPGGRGPVWVHDGTQFTFCRKEK